MFGWTQRRHIESRGFLSKRIIHKILFIQRLFFGNSYHINYGKFSRVIDPEKIIIFKSEDKTIYKLTGG